MKFYLRVFMSVLFLTVLFAAGCSKEAEQSVEQLVQTSISQLHNGEIEKAEKNAQKALKKAEEEKGPQHAAVIKPLEALALVYQAKNEFSKAVHSYERAIEIVKMASGEDSIDVAELMNNLATLYYSQKQYEKAKAGFQQSLSIIESHYSEHGPLIQKIKNNIKNCESALAGGESTAASGKAKSATAPLALNQMLPPDLVPEQIKNDVLKKLAEQNINLYDLSPLPPVKMGNQGVVLPYRCKRRMTEGNSEGIDLVLLFALTKNEKKESAYVFKQCRMVSYDSYMEELKKKDPTSLIQVLKEVFPRVFL